MSESPQSSGARPEEERVVAHYRALWQRHGDSHRALDWGSAASQQRRFEVLLDGIPLEGRRVLDVGCGLAHLADWITAQGMVVEYTGLDITSDLLQRASARHPQHRFVHGSVADERVLRGEHFDVVVSSGLFYTYVDGGWPYMQQTIGRLWEFTADALAFNSLSAWAPQHARGEFHADPVTVLDACRAHTTCLRLRHDYHPGDFTVQMWRERETPTR